MTTSYFFSLKELVLKQLIVAYQNSICTVSKLCADEISFNRWKFSLANSAFYVNMED